MDKKYEIVEGMEKVVKVEGGEIRLHRIRAIRAFCRFGSRDVFEGELGGWVADEGNLAQEGDCWVDGGAMVYGGARVWGDAMVEDNAVVNGLSEVRGCATVGGCATVTNHSVIEGEAVVCDNAVVESGHVLDKGEVSGDGVVRRGVVREEARVYCGMVEGTGVEGHTYIGIDGDVHGSGDRMTVDFPWLYTECGGMVWATCYMTKSHGISWAYDGISAMTGADMVNEVRLVHGEESAARVALVKGAVECCVGVSVALPVPSRKGGGIVNLNKKGKSRWN